MSAPLRELTPSEVDRLEHLRASFAGMPDADALIAEEERELRSLPIPSPCPSWCGLDAGHVYQSASAGAVNRFHQQALDPLVAVAQEERLLSDGTVEIGTPYMWLDRDDEFDADRADALAAALTKAAALIREIGGAA